MSAAKLNNGCQVSDLSPRQLQILKLIAEGWKQSAIAAALDVSEKTVCYHIANLYRQINCNGMIQATHWAIWNDLVKIRH